MEFTYATRQRDQAFAPPAGRHAVVVIDVIRAFTTAAYAFAAGAARILLTGEVEQALALRQAIPGSLVMGEVGGLPVPGFDYGNSPSALLEADLSGRTLIQRTSAGTQGMLSYAGAPLLFGGSFPCAGATARRLLSLDLEAVTFVVTGTRARDYLAWVNQPPSASPAPLPWGDEDQALGEYLEALLRGQAPDPAPYLQRVRRSPSGLIFSDPAQPEFPESDLDYCAALDAFDFCLQVQPEEDLLVMRPQKAGRA